MTQSDPFCASNRPTDATAPRHRRGTADTRPYRSTDIFLWNTVPSQNEPWNAGANSSFDGLNPRIGKPPAQMIFGNTPFLSAHLVGDTAWVDVIFIPREHHRRGRGRAIFEEWAAKLPASIRRIQLLAADLDGGSPIGFWTKMGFEVDGADFPEQFSGSYMGNWVATADRGIPIEEPRSCERSRV